MLFGWAFSAVTAPSPSGRCRRKMIRITNAKANPAASIAMNASEWMTGMRPAARKPPTILPTSRDPANSGKMRLLCSLSNRLPA